MLFIKAIDLSGQIGCWEEATGGKGSLEDW